MKQYVVQVFDKDTHVMIQQSDPHNWRECEEVNACYHDEYPNGVVLITPLP